MSIRSIAWSAFAVAAMASPALGQIAGDPAAGERLAAANCSQCHGLIDMQGGAPTFATIAAMPSTTEASLSAFLQTPHAMMPDLALTPSDQSDLIAYILSFR
jgi:mono/diheme cytochrome c family protein